jgi:hypothetical protein
MASELSQEQIQLKEQAEKRKEQIDSLTRQIAKIQRDILASEVTKAHSLDADQRARESQAAMFRGRF